jgi:murein L,D-transpeptidase YafK
MWMVRFIVVLALSFTLASCGNSKFKRYNGPAVTLIQVHKAERKMHLFHNDRMLKSFDIALGFAPEGHKAFEGDGKTPEGVYRIDRRNPNSAFHLSVGMSYPNDLDREFAEAAGRPPGGDIFIHGESRRPIARRDWTEGCIAVTDKEIEMIYAMVQDGTVINVLP